MQNYKKGILTLMILSAMSLMAAEDKTIYVNTFEDIDSDSSAKCSLRMALKAAAANKAYGGCSAGNTVASSTDTIQLEAGTYNLSSELVPTSQVIIKGKEALDYTQKDAITQQYPALTAVKTVISGQNNVRILNTTNAKSALTLNDLELRQGRSSDRGGALYLGGSTTLNRVNILNSSAANGGAIYLENGTSAVTISNSLIQGNTASTNAVLGMACRDFGVLNPRTLTLTNNSIIQNGSASSDSVLTFCGTPTATLTANTIALNTANPTSGSIIKFSSDQSNSQSSNLDASSNLTLENNTIVKNTAFSTFLYDKTGTKRLTLNALFANTGKSCRYAYGDAKLETSTGLNLSYNALVLSAAKEGLCDVGNEVLATQHNTIDVSTTSFSSLFEDLRAGDKNTNYLPVYFPRNNQNQSDLVDVGSTSCNAKNDQRGIQRITDATLLLNPAAANSCDIGSIELLKLTASDLKNLTNTSLVDLFTNTNSGYETLRDSYKKLIEDSATDPKFLPLYRDEFQKYSDLVTNTKANLKYRAIYVDPFAKSFANENAAHEIQPLNLENYNVSVQRFGIGALNNSSSTASVIKLRDDANLQCEWNPTLKRIIISRKDDTITQADEYNICQYTLTSKTDSSSQSSGLLFAQFVNIKPIAKDDEYSLQYGSSQEISVNLLSNDSDDGDGPSSTLTSNPNKPKFYRNDDGAELAVSLIDVPSGITIAADRTGNCPGDDIANLCYGGNLRIQVKNNFSPFNYSFKYVIYDAEGLKSEQATVKLVNTATTTNDSRGGGGSLGVFGLIGLMGLALYRRFK